MESVISGKSHAINIIGKVNILPGAIQTAEIRQFKGIAEEIKDELYANIVQFDRLLLKQALENEWK